jgi:hypothetical protein
VSRDAIRRNLLDAPWKIIEKRENTSKHAMWRL